MPEPLFHAQERHTRRAHRLGHIQLARPLQGRWLTVAALLAAFVVLAFLCLASYTPRSTVVGRLVPIQGLVTVTAPVAGVVSWLDVSEGARVSAQGTLALVSIPQATVDAGDTRLAMAQQLQLRHDSLERGHRAGQAQLHAQRQGLLAQLAGARREVLQLEAEVRTRRQQVRIATEALQRLRQLEHRQYVSLLQVTRQQAMVLDYTGQMQGLERQASALRREVVRLRQAVDEVPARAEAASATHAHALAQLRQQRLQADADGALIVRAPVAGMVATRLVSPGQAVQAGQPLVTLLPGDGRLEAELWVPGRAIAFVAPGDDVRLRYQAFPHQTFGHQRGTVLRISRSAIDGSQRPASTREGGDAPFYRITVRLLHQDIVTRGSRVPLMPGMALSADLMGERRRLIEWVFVPLRALSGGAREAS